MNKLMRLQALALSAALLGTVAVSAQTGPTNTTGQERREDIMQLRQERLSEAKKNRINQQCVNLQDRLGRIGSRVTTLKDSRGNLVDNIIRVLTNFAERVEAAGLDATALEEDIATLQTMADEADTLWGEYQAALESLTSSRCSEEEEAQSWHEALQEVRLARLNVKDKLGEIRQFFTTEIKDELSAIRSQLTDQPSEEREESEVEENEANDEVDNTADEQADNETNGDDEGEDN